uniref:Uncharacterized protein n=1 Tax=Lactococcus lactis TaxID=1358 RepID=Q2VHS4_9LACT|nr:hypothetical protein pSK11B_6 [Lactococcus lactis]
MAGAIIVLDCKSRTKYNIKSNCFLEVGWSVLRSSCLGRSPEGILRVYI